MRAELTLFEVQFSPFSGGLAELFLTTADEMRLPYNGSLGCFNATVGETGMKQGTLFDAYLIAV